jgi:pyruvate,water dikinase
MTAADVSDLTPQSWDPLFPPRTTSGTWSTSNVGEALPGVPTPLGWSVWATGQQSLLNGFYAIGAITRRERPLSPRIDDQFLVPFYGRGAMNIEHLAGLADRMPGTSGPAIAEQILGRCPPHITANPSYNRYPFIAVKLPWTFATVARRVRRARTETHAWYTRTIPTIDGLDLPAATAVFADACRRFEDNVSVQAISLFGAIQPIYEQLTVLARKAGVDGNAIMGGYGSHAETEIVVDLWRAGRGELTGDELVNRHGYHGPLEGEISAHVWRENPDVLHRIVGDYTKLPEDRNPARMARELVQRRVELEADLLTRLPRAYRPVARAVLAAARTYIPLRGTAKVAFLQAIDVARAAARRIGTVLAEAGTIDEPEDVFYLTLEEIVAGPRQVTDLLARRKERRRRFQQLDVPPWWEGIPTPRPVAGPAKDTDRDPDDTIIEGIGVSAGVVEGTVRVVMDPDFADFEGDEVLVAPTTDPSWASVLYLSKALVVDIGGALSHAAIVARELGIPCVVNTGDGTTRLRTGDQVRVDGSSGRVEILGR